MGCSPNICFQNNRLYLCPRRPYSLKWWHTTRHKCPVVCCTMLGCVQVGSVVWRVTCEHVSKTKRKFITRFKEHLTDNRHNCDTPVAKHYNLSSYKNNTTPVFPLPTILSRIAGPLDRTTGVRKNKEKMWVYTLRSIAPDGINLRE